MSWPFQLYTCNGSLQISLVPAIYRCQGGLQIEPFFANLLSYSFTHAQSWAKTMASQACVFYICTAASGPTSMTIKTAALGAVLVTREEASE